MKALDRYKAKALTVGDNPEWVEGFPVFTTPSGRLYMKDGQDDKRFGCGVDVNPDTLCQCTGLKDKQEKLIFDGDYLVDFQGDLWVVFWNYTCWDVRHVVLGHEDELTGHDMTLTGKNIHDKQTEQ